MTLDLRALLEDAALAAGLDTDTHPIDGELWTIDEEGCYVDLFIPHEDFSQMAELERVLGMVVANGTHRTGLQIDDHFVTEEWPTPDMQGRAIAALRVAQQVWKAKERG